MIATPFGSLFKYLHSDRIDVIRSGLIRFSSPQDLNDPFELQPHLKGVAESRMLNEMVSAEIAGTLRERLRAIYPAASEKQLEDYVSRANVPELLASDFNLGQRASAFLDEVNQTLQKFANSIGILCLTESKTNLLMWAHYAQSHRGFLIEFDPESEFFRQQRTAEDEFGALRQVKYMERRPSIYLSDADAESVFLAKGVEWSYEAEWRMFMPLSRSSKQIKADAENIHLFYFPKSAIRSVVLGASATKKTFEEVVSIVSGDSSLSHVSIEKGAISSERYALEFQMVREGK